MQYFLDGSIKQIGEIQEFGNFKKENFWLRLKNSFQNS